MTINAILAYDKNYGIGNKGDLPWPRNDADMKWFRECTNDHVVVMGRKTWESLGSVGLKNRINVVITSSKIYGTPDYTYQGDIRLALDDLRTEYPHLKVWVIGGANIYEQALPYCDQIYTTRFNEDYECDTFVDMEKYLRGYVEMAKKEKDKLTFSIWSRKI